MEELLAKYFSGEISKDERSLVESWRSESEENAMSFFDAKSIWLDSLPIQPPHKEKLDLILGNEPQAKTSFHVEYKLDEDCSCSFNCVGY